MSEIYTADDFITHIFDEKLLLRQTLNLDIGHMFWNTSTSDRIYHYTDLAGFLGILSSGCIWAGNIRFLNDAEEFRNGQQICLEILQKYIDSSTTSSSCGTFLKSIQKHLTDNEINTESALSWDMDKIFSASFCQEGDLLSQWRGYGGQSGISIGFSYNQMRSAVILPKSKYEYIQTHDVYPRPADANEETSFSERGLLLYPPSEVNWVQTAYQQEEKEKLLRQLITNIISNFNNNPPESTFPNKYSYLSADLLRQLFPAMKNPGFQEEKECRMLAYYFSAEKVDISYRAANGLLIPYVNFRILDGHGRPFSTVLPIEEIIVGPGPNQEKVYQSILYFLSHQIKPELKGLSDLVGNVRKSVVPLV